MLRSVALTFTLRRNFLQFQSITLTHCLRFCSNTRVSKDIDDGHQAEKIEQVRVKKHMAPKRSKELLNLEKSSHMVDDVKTHFTKSELVAHLKTLKKFENDLESFQKSFPDQPRKTNIESKDSVQEPVFEQGTGSGSSFVDPDIDRLSTLTDSAVAGQLEIVPNTDTSVEGRQDEELDVIEKEPKKEFNRIYSLAAVINESKCLQKLVALEVDLSLIQKNHSKIAKYLIQCDFDKDVVPYLQFLRHYNVENVGKVLTRNIGIIKTDMEILKNRVDYLESKGFNPEAITRMISNSQFLLRDVQKVDEDLGILQQLFSLSGREVKEVVTKSPKIINYKRMALIKKNKTHCEHFLGFKHLDLKTILLSYPGFFLKSQWHLDELFEYLYNVMEFDHKSLVKNCHVFKSRPFIVKNRHLYLLKVKRAQYDPDKENYVSLPALVSGTNEEFCANIAKTSVEKYLEFVKYV